MTAPPWSALAAHQAVRMNLLMSLVTLAALAVARFRFASFPISPR